MYFFGKEYGVCIFLEKREYRGTTVCLEHSLAVK